MNHRCKTPLSLQEGLFCGSEAHSQEEDLLSLTFSACHFRRSPSQGLREVLLVMGSLTSCDPGDIFETIENFRRDGIRSSVIGLAAEVHVCKVLCKETGGEIEVEVLST